MKSLVSVVIPSYNDSSYVKEAIHSVLSQTYENIEIIVVDDGSTDDTKEVLKEYKDRIKYHYQKNKGLSGARNTGMKLAKGKYISLLDADDLYHKDRVEKQVNFLENSSGCVFSYSGYRHFYDGKPDELLKLKYKYHSGNVFKKLLRKNFIAPSGVLFRKDILDKIGFFDESLKSCEDWDYWLRVSHEGLEFSYIPEAITFIRIRKSGNLNDRSFRFLHKIDSLRVLGKYRDVSGINKYHAYHAWGLLLSAGYPKFLKVIINKYLNLRDKWRYQR